MIYCNLPIKQGLPNNHLKQPLKKFEKKPEALPRDNDNT